MGLFGKMLRNVVDVVALPVNIAVDAITLFPDAINEKRPFDSTRRNVERIGERTQDILDKLDE